MCYYGNLESLHVAYIFAVFREICRAVQVFRVLWDGLLLHPVCLHDAVLPG